MIFEERPAPPGLADMVSRLWFLQAPRIRRYEKILPIPSVHLIVNLSDAYRLYDREGVAAVVGDAFVSGVQTRYLVIESPPTIRHVGIELRPDGLAAIADVDGRGVADVVQDAGAVVSGIDELVPRLRALSRDPDAALAALGAFVLARDGRRRPDPAVRHVVDALAADPDQRIGTLADETGLPHRALIERFRRATGLTPKAYAQVDRFHRFLSAIAASALDGSRPPDWTALTGESAYYDQPHVIRAFRRFCGWTPTEYHRRVVEFGPDAASFVPLDEVPVAGAGQAQARS